MDQAGVSTGMLCAWHGPAGPMISNDEVAHFCRAYPSRFVGVASVDLYRPIDGVRELRRRVRQDGFKGLRVLPWVWGLPPDDRRYYPLFAECCELDIPFCTQVGHAGPLRESEPGRPIPYLDRVAVEFPELRIVGGHIGVPWLSEMLSLLMKYPNVFIRPPTRPAAIPGSWLITCATTRGTASCSDRTIHSGRRANALPVSTLSISGNQPQPRSSSETQSAYSSSNESSPPILSRQ